jgi:Na+/melibiose symporter-like transporter
MTFFAVTGVIFFIITFLTTRERIVPAQSIKSSVSQDLSDLFKNKPWVIMLFLTILVFITLSLKGGMYIYYFKYYLHEPAIASFLDHIGFTRFTIWLYQTTGFQWPNDPATSGNSLFNASGIIFMILGIMISKPLADRFGKRDVFGAFLFLSGIFILMLVFYSPDSIGLVFITQILHGFFYGVTIPLLWAMIADVADYSEWKNNRRATAIIFSAMIFGLKVGLSVGGALGAGLLAKYGYVAEAPNQTAGTISGIKMSVSVYPFTLFFIGVILLAGYAINKKTELTIERELKARRV